ncbi:hypothetical protein CYMTET_4580 [Cymbomonas tetramitiformis]|uniref:Nucleotide-diphospho-sugar transferase domain-containing protein n=1 Tax=Cymbomonas tetramitiformis TaxID=36881 RepID=A0AAE0LJR1_9CHLO|nr:hypothetical protein CYMTET_4580 [Cymbomonas tetramitiformis]
MMRFSELKNVVLVAAIFILVIFVEEADHFRNQLASNIRASIAETPPYDLDASAKGTAEQQAHRGSKSPSERFRDSASTITTNSTSATTTAPTAAPSNTPTSFQDLRSNTTPAPTAALSIRTPSLVSASNFGVLDFRGPKPSHGRLVASPTKFFSEAAPPSTTSPTSSSELKSPSTEQKGWAVCSVIEGQSCNCNGTVHFGPKFANAVDGPINTLEQLKAANGLTAASKTSILCDSGSFLFDPSPGVTKFCICEGDGGIDLQTYGRLQPETKGASTLKVPDHVASILGSVNASSRLRVVTPTRADDILLNFTGESVPGLRARFLWNGYCVDGSTNIDCFCAEGVPKLTLEGCDKRCADKGAQCTGFAFHENGLCRIYSQALKPWKSGHLFWSQYKCYGMPTKQDGTMVLSREPVEKAQTSDADLAAMSAASAAERAKQRDEWLSSLEMPPASGWESGRYVEETEFLSLGKMPPPLPPMDLETPGNLRTALANTAYKGEVIFMVSNRGHAHLAVNMVLNLRFLGMDHALLVADTAELCQELGEHVENLGCHFSSQMTREPVEGRKTSASFKIWTMRKQYIGRIVGLGYNVFQTDTDVVWWLNPYPALKSMFRDKNIVMQNEGSLCPGANGGVLYSQNVTVGGPAHWTLGEIPRRVLELSEHPERLQIVAPEAFAEGISTRSHKIMLGGAMKVTDEQDMLNDVMASAFQGELVRFFSTRVFILEQIVPWELRLDPVGRDEIRMSWMERHNLNLKWEVSRPEPEEFGMFPDGMCTTKSKQRFVQYRQLHQVAGLEVHNATEYAAAAPQWLFGGQSSIRALTRLGCLKDLPPRTSWQERLPLKEAIVHHLVGPAHESRELLMRALGAWHYYPVDLLKNMFPLDGSRVLGLAAMPPEGLAFNGTAEDVKEKIFRLLRRLMLIAAVADRLPVAPVFSCQVIQMREDFVHDLPCPNTNVSCCIFTPPDGCTRKVIVHQPEVEWLRQQIPAEYSHEIALSDVAGAELPAQDSAAWTAWSADEWRPVAAEKRSQLSAGRIASMLTDERRMVMNLDVPGLSNGDGDEVLRHLPEVVSDVKDADVARLRVKHCVGLVKTNDHKGTLKMLSESSSPSPVIEHIKTSMKLQRPQTGGSGSDPNAQWAEKTARAQRSHTFVG